MKQKKFFITGTDTGIGKTIIATSLLHAFTQQGFSTFGLKPIACGCAEHIEGLRNEDGLMLQQMSSVSLPYEVHNPITYAEPISPNIAADNANVELSTDSISRACQPAWNVDADVTIIEGCGGWYCPINASETVADFVIAQELPVILVVGLRLGCLNHSLLTYHAIQHSGLKCAGWVVNYFEDSMLYAKENIETLQATIKAPLLGEIPYHHSPDPRALSRYLNVEPLRARRGQV